MTVLGVLLPECPKVAVAHVCGPRGEAERPLHAWGAPQAPAAAVVGREGPPQAAVPSQHRSPERKPLPPRAACT